MEALDHHHAGAHAVEGFRDQPHRAARIDEADRLAARDAEPGEIVRVDGGYHVLGMPQPENLGG